MISTEDCPRVAIYDLSADAWRWFERPREIIETCRHDEVLNCLRRIEQLVETEGVYAAGFVSYEAAPAFDRALTVREAPGFPLLWFGLFPAARTVAFATLDALARERNTACPPPADPRSGSGSSAGSNEWQPSVAAGDYFAVIQQIREKIAAGETYQVNYTFRLRRPADGNPWELFEDLVAAQRPPYAAYIETPDFAICSASPELFFELDGRRIVSRPMKGTIARGRWNDEDLARARELAASEKNRAENAMIVDMMRNDLGRIARVGSVEVSDLFRVERYPTLWQMTSLVSAETDASLTEIVAAMFPCASITGAPKASTMRIIARSETSPRRVYTGSIGVIAPGRRARFNVAIRTLLVDKVRREAEYGVGGGVVWDSTPRGEYDECLLKARIVTSRRPEFSLLETLLWTPEEGYFCLPEHLRRLRQSAEYFGFPRCDEDADGELEILAAGLPAAPHKVRLLVAQDGKISCQAEPMLPGEFPDPVRLTLAAAPIDADDAFLYHKTTRRAVYAAALAACREDAASSNPQPMAAACPFDDVLLYNQHGELTETTLGNIVVRCGDEFRTPPVSCGLLAGAYRARLLAQGKICERAIPLAALGECDELFFINSVRGWRKARLAGPRDPRSLAARLGVKAP